MQTVGTDEFQIKYGKNIWTTYLFNTITKYRSLGFKWFIITDVRFIHELEFIKSNFVNKNLGVILRINNMKRNSEAIEKL